MRSYIVKCDQCQAYSINGMAVHEASSCPNDRMPWKIEGDYCVPDREPKFSVYECDDFDYEEIMEQNERKAYV